MRLYSVQPYNIIERRMFMKRIFTGILALSLSVGMMLVPTLTAKAQENTYAVDGTLLTYDSESHVDIYPLTRGVYLSACSATVSCPSTGLVCGTAKTYANFSIPKLYVDVYIQRYTGSGWTTVANWIQYAYNTAYVGSSKVYSVPRGYYYRTASVHYANGDYGSGFTSGIYIA